MHICACADAAFYKQICFPMVEAFDQFFFSSIYFFKDYIFFKNCESPVATGCPVDLFPSFWSAHIIITYYKYHRVILYCIYMYIYIYSHQLSLFRRKHRSSHYRKKRSSFAHLSDTTAAEYQYPDKGTLGAIRRLWAGARIHNRTHNQTHNRTHNHPYNQTHNQTHNGPTKDSQRTQNGITTDLQWTDNRLTIRLTMDSRLMS